MGLREEYYGKKVLVTGGAGFIGSNLAIRLVELGANVYIADCKLKGYGANDFNLKSIGDRIKFFDVDIRDADRITRLISSIDVIFNLAAQVGESSGEKDPYLDLDINILGHHNVLEACRKINPRARLVFPGSRLQYGRINDDTEIVSEEQPMNPLSTYARDKVFGEKMYLDYHRKHGLKTTVLRIANPFGPRASIRNPGYCIVNWFVGKALRGEALPVYGDGAQLRDYIYIDDLVDAFLVAGAHKDAIGKVYNVGSGKGTKFKDMAELITDLSGNSSTLINFVEWPEQARQRETGNFVADISRIRNELGWAPRVELPEAVKKTIEFYKENMAHYAP